MRAQIQMCFVTNVQLRHFPTMTQNANQADGNRIMSSKLMDVIVYLLTSVATMNAKLWMSNLAGKMDKKVLERET